MNKFRENAWPKSAWAVAFLAVYALFWSALGNYSVFTHVGEPSLGAFVFWDVRQQCLYTSVVTPLTWPAIENGVLEHGDCILEVDGTVYKDKQHLAHYLAEPLDAEWQDQHVEVLRLRQDESATVTAPIMKLTWEDLLQIQLGLILPGLALWLVGLLVLLANPLVESNRLWAAFLLLGSLSIMGAGEDFGVTFFKPLYVWLVTLGSRPFLGALLFHLATIWPHRIESPLLQRLRWVLYLIAGINFLLIAPELFSILLPKPLPYVEITSLTGKALSLALFVLGGGAIFLRTLYTWWKPVDLRSRNQARLLTVALLSPIPLVLSDMLITQFGLQGILPDTSNLTFTFWIIPGATLVAYAMLRYQTFAYRGQALNALVILMTSAALTQVYGFFVRPGGWDGLQYSITWGAALMMTIFLFVDTPLRRAFRRLFVRHEYDYETANRFSQHMAATQSLDETLSVAATALCTELEVAWVAVTSVDRPESVWLAHADQPDVLAQPLGADPPSVVLPDQPTYERTVMNGDRQVGALWLGARTTAEPFDEKDAQLVALLSQELARTLAVHAQIEGLERVPGLILAAVETDRKRIGQDLHDGVLQFMGAIPLDLDRAGALATKDPNAAQAILERAIERAIHISQDTRAIVYDLSPPGLAHSGLLSQTRLYVQQACHSHGVALDWQEEPAGWADLSEERALQVYRIVQQGVSNALEHGRPRQVQVHFGRSAGLLRLEIGDDGAGFDPERPGSGAGLGLLSMQERARALGGQLQITSTPGRGTRLRLHLPEAPPR